MRWQGFATGFLGLIALEAVVSSQTATDRFGNLATGLGALAEKIISPTVPAFSAPATSSGSASSPKTTSAQTSTPAAQPTPAALPAPGSGINPSFFSSPLPPNTIAT